MATALDSVIAITPASDLAHTVSTDQMLSVLLNASARYHRTVGEPVIDLAVIDDPDAGQYDAGLLQLFLRVPIVPDDVVVNELAESVRADLYRKTGLTWDLNWSTYGTADQPPWPPSEAPLPVLTSVTPDTGAEDDEVVLAGTGFTDASLVLFDGAEAVFAVDSDVQITATVPAHIDGAVGVTVVTPGGPSVTDGDDFTYAA